MAQEEPKEIKLAQVDAPDQDVLPNDNDQEQPLPQAIIPDSDVDGALPETGALPLLLGNMPPWNLAPLDSLAPHSNFAFNPTYHSPFQNTGFENLSEPTTSFVHSVGPQIFHPLDDSTPDIESHSEPGAPPFGVYDPLFPQQWALFAMNVPEAWKDYTGKGVTLSVIDEGLEYDHEDLAPNYLPGHAYNAHDLTNDPWPWNTGLKHGTSTTGVIIAAKNGLGMVGVAYDAQYSFCHVDLVNNANASAEVSDALDHSAWADVINMSIASNGFGITQNQLDAIEARGTLGRGGLGTIMVKSAGNERDDGLRATCDGRTILPYIITVGATDQNGNYTSFSSPGSNVLVSAPGVDIAITDRAAPNGYNPDGNYDSVQGTSFSGPLVSGVALLMLEANPNLGFQDVQTILASTATKTAGTYSAPGEVPRWQINGAEFWNGGGMHASHDYGYGQVDALAAVRVAESWDQPARTAANQEITGSTATPNTPLTDGGWITETINIGTDFTVEHALVGVTITNGNASDLTIRLISPEGTDSLLVRFSNPEFDNDPNATFNFSDFFPFRTTQCLGENANGDWTLMVYDKAGNYSPTLVSWELKLYGETPDNNDIYIFTDEFSDMVAMKPDRTTLDDTAGEDTLNAAAVTTASHVDLRAGAESTIDGTTLEMGAGTVIENVHTGDGNDTLIGNDADNELFGWRGNDSISSGIGDDTLFGGTGSDTLTGGIGNDLFLYDDPLEGNDRITDFSHTDDAFGFDFSQFGQAGTGTLGNGHFFTSSADVDVAEDCFIFQNDTLWYDPDGTGSDSALRIAVVEGDDIQADDITFV